jgi:glycine/D-amino acid oxidase-like deaminating enzyme
MPSVDHPKDPVAHYDIVICGGGIAGLWLLNILIAAGFSVLLVEKDALGGTQTIASQGMIHGGQRYMLGANPSAHAERVAPLPDRWDACLEGRGEIDLREVRVLSAAQVMWPAGGRLTQLVLSSATLALKASMRKLNVQELPEALAGIAGLPVYELPEKVLDTLSLVKVLAAPHSDHIRKGSIDKLTREGRLIVSGYPIKAQLIICAAGLGNETLLSLLEADKIRSQQRPLRQIMVKTMPFPLFGHGITTSHKPRVTVTSYPLQSGGYVWYVGGAIADHTISLTDDEALTFAKREMKKLFANFDWSGKQWGTWYGVRAEPYCPAGTLPDGPAIQEYSNTLVVWPTKLTLTPLLGDRVMARLEQKGVRPKHVSPASPWLDLAVPPLARLPWDRANWVC